MHNIASATITLFKDAYISCIPLELLYFFLLLTVIAVMNGWILCPNIQFIFIRTPKYLFTNEYCEYCLYNCYHESWHSVLFNRHPQPRHLDRPGSLPPPYLCINPFHKPFLFFSSSFLWGFRAKDHVLTARSLRFLLVEVVLVEDDALDCVELTM